MTFALSTAEAGYTEGKDLLSWFQIGCLLCGFLRLLLLSGCFILDDILGRGLATNGNWRHWANISPCVPYKWSPSNEKSSGNGTQEGLFLKHPVNKFLCHNKALALAPNSRSVIWPSLLNPLSAAHAFKMSSTTPSLPPSFPGADSY